MEKLGGSCNWLNNPALIVPMNRVMPPSSWFLMAWLRLTDCLIDTSPNHLDMNISATQMPDFWITNMDRNHKFKKLVLFLNTI